MYYHHQFNSKKIMLHVKLLCVGEEIIAISYVITETKTVKEVSSAFMWEYPGDASTL